MLKTIAELRLLIEDKESNYTNNLSKLSYGATTTKITELNGAEVVLSKPFDFENELESLDSQCASIAHLRGLLAKANNTTFIDEVDTIQTAIVKLQKKRAILNKVEYILDNTRESKRRRTDGSMSNASAYYEEICLNYNEDTLTAYRDNLRTELNTLEVKIQNANNLSKFDISEEK